MFILLFSRKIGLPTERSPTTGNQPRRVTNGRTSSNNQQQARINNCDPKKSCPEVSTLNLGELNLLEELNSRIN